MGRRIIACATEEPTVQIVAELDQGDTEPWIDGRETADVMLDFSSVQGAQIAVRAALAKRAALLVGTTGLPEETMALLRAASSTIPLMVAPNTSLGVAVARHLVSAAARLLGDSYDLEILERHHRHKLDAPSGTAKALAEASKEAGRPVRPDRIHAQRLGDIVGEHIVTFAGQGEVLEIRHQATSRDLFARGALRIGAWLAQQPPGWYGIDAWIASISGQPSVNPR